METSNQHFIAPLEPNELASSNSQGQTTPLLDIGIKYPMFSTTKCIYFISDLLGKDLKEICLVFVPAVCDGQKKGAD